MTPQSQMKGVSRCTANQTIPLTAFLTRTPSLTSLLTDLHHFDVSKRLEVWQCCGGGGYADVYAGRLEVKHNDDDENDDRFVKVAVKRFRIFAHTDGESSMRVARELRILATVKHDNVVPFRGFATVDGVPSLVTDWMENGTLNEYLRSKGQVDESFLTIEIAKGLGYLHTVGIIHSDLKSDNILINTQSVPVLTDFGISRVIHESVTVTGTSSLKGNARWMSIELLDSRVLEEPMRKHDFHTKQSDVWAYGMVVSEIITGEMPFHEFTNEIHVLMAIAAGKLPVKPERPGNMKLDTLWSVCERCWARNPADRPTMGDVLDELLYDGSSVELSQIYEFNAHAKFVTCVAFSPVNSRVLATSSLDNTVCIWNLSEDRQAATLLHQLVGHDRWVQSIAWSNDALFLVSGSEDKTIRKWDVSTGKCEFVIKTRRVYPLEYSPDNSHIVSGDDSASLNVWDALTGDRILGPLTCHANDVWAVAYSPNGRYIVSGSVDKTVIVWDSTTGTKLFGPLTQSNYIRSIAFHPSGETFVTGSDKTITIWDANTYMPIHKNLTAHRNWVKSVQYSPDGRFILSASEDKTLRVWDARIGKVVSEPALHTRAIEAAAFSPDGRWVASGGGRSVKIWELRELD